MADGEELPCCMQIIAVAASGMSVIPPPTGRAEETGHADERMSGTSDYPLHPS